MNYFFSLNAGKMRIQFCLLASGVLLGAMVPVIILYSGISYTKYPKEFTSAQSKLCSLLRSVHMYFTQRGMTEGKK